VQSLPSDNMAQIMTHGYQRDYLDRVNRVSEEERKRAEYNRINKRGQHTKASKLKLEM